ncbi:hypothetical protein Calab_0833 [Caldithrix abyssi DSM 13497]|uniref:YokE-like PH domain-containing protein n=1 Tax=Caldithrix abyssi DSM 13497 TaxID=880073 RepID=H1XU28_CALAY|nr:hypothetical protein [Caldithrix abyssi]EHO40471.1 hypothetical protein Calab_0833 [Caldithrix abyssi DSM 13497]
MNHKYNLLPDEQVILESDNKILTLTNKRIRYDYEKMGGSDFISITLDSVSSCGLETKSYPVFLVLAFISMFGVFVLESDGKIFAFVLFLLFIFIYFITRKAFFIISSNGGQNIQLPASSMSRSAIIEFLETVENEKIKYLEKVKSFT